MNKVFPIQMTPHIDFELEMTLPNCEVCLCYSGMKINDQDLSHISVKKKKNKTLLLQYFNIS